MRRSRWTRRQLQSELRRRDLFPPTSFTMGYSIRQEITAGDLTRELTLIPLKDASRGWHEFEHALAMEHERTRPGQPFVRYLVPPS